MPSGYQPKLEILIEQFNLKFSRPAMVRWERVRTDGLLYAV